MTLLEPDLRRTRLEYSHVFYQMAIVVGAEGADEVARATWRQQVGQRLPRSKVQFDSSLAKMNLRRFNGKPVS